MSRELLRMVALTLNICEETMAKAQRESGAEVVSADSDYVTGPNVTLILGGTLISGTLIGKRSYHRRVTKHYDSTKSKGILDPVLSEDLWFPPETNEQDTDQEPIRTAYLIDITVISGGTQMKLTKTEAGIHIDSVDGVFFGASFSNIGS